MMKRQCAWCLRLMNSDGEHLSARPVPKIYNATHGICGACGKQWIEVATDTEDATDLCIQLRLGTTRDATQIKHLSI